MSNEKISKVNIELHIPAELPDTKNKINIIIKAIINSYTNIELCLRKNIQVLLWSMETRKIMRSK